MTDLHPHILITTDETSRLPTVSSLRAAVGRPGARQRLWQLVQAAADAGLQAPPITSFDSLPGRSTEDVRRGNRDYRIVDAAGQRVTQAALAALLTQDRRYVVDPISAQKAISAR